MIPRESILFCHFSKLSVQCCGFFMIGANGLFPFGTEAILIQRIDVNGQSYLVQRARCYDKKSVQAIHTSESNVPTGSEEREIISSHGATVWVRGRPTRWWHLLCHSARPHYRLVSLRVARQRIDTVHVHDAKASPPVTIATLVSPFAMRRAASSNN